MKTKESVMKTKLLKRLREEAECRVGVLYYKGEYIVIFDKATMYNSSFGKFEECPKRYQVCSRHDTLEKAKKSCDAFRREYILMTVRKMRYGNSDRLY